MILAAFNPKGGVGKTTTGVNVSAVLAQAGRSVLLVDLEADYNASISLGVRHAQVAPSIADLLLRQKRADAVIRTVPGTRGLHLITGSPVLADIDTALRNVRQPERRLADVLRPLAAQFDVIVIDAPAGFSRVAEGVATAADYLIVPVRAEYLPLESLAHFLRWYRDRHRVRRATATLAGILMTMVDYRVPATREIIEIIRTHNRRGVFQTEIPFDPRVSEAPSHGVPVVRYAPRARASVAYERLTAELLQRLRSRR